MAHEVRVIVATLLGAMPVYACTSHSGADGIRIGAAGEPAGGQTTAGAGSEGAHAGAGGAAGAGGRGGGNNDKRDACGPYPLAELCTVHPTSCPSPAELPLDGQCCFGRLQRSESSCGGTVVRETGDYTASWSYDTNDDLVGFVITGDLGTPCEEGGWSFTVMYGHSCEPAGSPVDLCQRVEDACGSGGASGAGGVAGAGATAG